MQSESVSQLERRVERSIMDLLLIDDRRTLWSDDEIAAEVMGEVLDVHDALRRLAGGGLVHRLDRFVFATRSAVRAAEVGLETIPGERED